MSYLLLSFSLLVPCAPVAPGPKDKPKRVKVGPNVTVEIAGKKRRVIVSSSVVLRKGPLEGLLTRKKTKEHEYILAGDFDARHLHAALILASAKPGAPVAFAPKYKPASGSKVRVSLRYNKAGKSVTVSARDWIKNHKTGKPLALDWVFGGSRFVPPPDGMGMPFYLANYGDVICLCNMDSAMLDLPVPSPKALDDRIYEANTASLPPMGTAVEVIFEVVPDKKK